MINDKRFGKLRYNGCIDSWLCSPFSVPFRIDNNHQYILGLSWFYSYSVKGYGNFNVIHSKFYGYDDITSYIYNSLSSPLSITNNSHFL